VSVLGEHAIAYEIKNLADEDSRKSAIRTLKAFGKTAIPQLVDVLGDQSRNAYAAILLSEIGEPAIPALLNALSDETKKSFAAIALNEMGKEKNGTLKIIIPSLIDTLYNKNPRTRAIAGVTLLNFGVSNLEPFIPNLINALGNVDASPFAANVLIGIGKPVVGPLSSFESDENKQIWVNNIIQEISKKDPTLKMPTNTNEKPTAILSQTFNQVKKQKFCRYCGSALTENSLYCSNCGKKVE
jgi:hypothetical protein